MAQVSQATAARALGGYGYVSQEARRSVQAAAAQLDYRPNNAARTLVMGTSNIVGFVVGDIENAFFATAARGLADILEESGYTLLVANSDEESARERRAIDSLRAHRVDGLVVAPTNSNRSPHLGELEAAGVPLVLLDRTVRGLAVDSVVTDGAGGAALAVEHLAGLGHQRIGLVIDNLSVPLDSMTARLRGWRNALRRLGLPADGTLVSEADERMADGYKATLDLLQRSHCPTALFAASNFMTVGALRAIRELGLRIPEDIAVVAFDDMDVLPLFEPPITAVAQPVRRLGQEAGRLLLRRLAGDVAKPQRLQLRAELVVRRSCGALST